MKLMLLNHPSDQMKKCTRCGSDKTHIRKNGKKDWYNVYDNIICDKCHAREYNLKNHDYRLALRILNIAIYKQINGNVIIMSMF
jgi:hypothetical protein